MALGHLAGRQRTRLPLIIWQPATTTHLAPTRGRQIQPRSRRHPATANLTERYAANTRFRKAARSHSERGFEERSISCETIARKTPSRDNCHGFKAPTVQASRPDPKRPRLRVAALPSKALSALRLSAFGTPTPPRVTPRHPWSLPSKTRCHA